MTSTSKEKWMTFRTGTYVITDEGPRSDMKGTRHYLATLNAWLQFQGFILKSRNNYASRDSMKFNSAKKLLVHNIVAQLKSSKQCVLILTKNTKKLTGIIPFELTYAMDECQLPLIIMYPDYESITTPQKLSIYWPKELRTRIENRQVKAVHIPFMPQPAKDSLRRFHVNGKQTLPNGYGHFSIQSYQEWGLQASHTENVAMPQMKRRWPLSLKFAR